MSELFILLILLLLALISNAFDCENEGAIKHIDWHQLLNANSTIINIQKPDVNLSLIVDLNTLTTIIEIDLEYIGNSTNDLSLNNEYKLGTTYVIDFQSFSTSGNVINEAGNCQNRLSSSFDGITNFNQYWKYSNTPYIDDGIGSNLYLSYPPPSNFWSLSIDNNTCTPIKYKGIFSWNDLIECKDYNGNSLININDNLTEIKLSGTLYVNLVSPYSMNVIDSGIYRSFPLIQKDFEISILKQINVLSSTGINLFIISIIGIFEDETDGSFEMSILTQSADYIQLTNGQILSSPTGSAIIEPNSITGNNCLTASSFTCGQLFQIKVNNHNKSICPSNVAGIYDISFTVNCPENQTECNTFINDNGGSNQIALSVQSNFIDNNCEPEIYKLVFNGNMIFYDDKNFTMIHNENINDNNYVIGQDTIYVQIEVDFPDDGTGDNYNIFNVEIDNVFVCTADDNIDLTINNNDGNGPNGCLSNNIDDNSLHNLIVNGIAMSSYFVEIVEYDQVSNIVRFSFLTLNIGRTKMYIHSQLTLLLKDNDNNNNNPIRRRILLQTSNTNQIRHFIGDVTVTETEDIDTKYSKDSKEDTNNNKKNVNDIEVLLSYIAICIGICCIFIVFGIIYICRKKNQSLEKHLADLNNQIRTNLDVPVRVQMSNYSETMESFDKRMNRNKPISYDKRKIMLMHRAQMTSEYNLNSDQLDDLMNIIDDIDINMSIDLVTNNNIIMGENEDIQNKEVVINRDHRTMSTKL